MLRAEMDISAVPLGCLDSLGLNDLP